MLNNSDNDRYLIQTLLKQDLSSISFVREFTMKSILIISGGAIVALLSFIASAKPHGLEYYLTLVSILFLSILLWFVLCWALLVV